MDVNQKNISLDNLESKNYSKEKRVSRLNYANGTAIAFFILFIIGIIFAINNSKGGASGEGSPLDALIFLAFISIVPILALFSMVSYIIGNIIGQKQKQFSILYRIIAFICLIISYLLQKYIQQVCTSLNLFCSNTNTGSYLFFNIFLTVFIFYMIIYILSPIIIIPLIKIFHK